MFIILINLGSPTSVKNALCLKKCSTIMPFAFICWEHRLSALNLQLSTQAGERAAKHLGRVVGTDLWSLLLLKIH